MTIYFVDEDFGPTAAMRAIVEQRGHKVEAIVWVEDAETILTTVKDIDLVLIDVMMAQRGGDDRYSAHRTNTGLETGLKLLEILSDKRSEVFPGRAVLWTHAQNTEVIKRATNMADELGIEFMRKGKFRSVKDFADAVEGCLAAVQASGKSKVG